MRNPIDLWHAFSLCVFVYLPTICLDPEFILWFPVICTISAFGVHNVLVQRGIVSR